MEQVNMFLHHAQRESVHPYPQKALKKVVSQATGALQSSASMLESVYVVRLDSLSVPGNAFSSAALSPWTYNVLPAGNVSQLDIVYLASGMMDETIVLFILLIFR